MVFIISLVAKQIHFPTNNVRTLDLIESIICNLPASKITKTKSKHLIKLYFVNKGMNIINISKIIIDKSVKKTLLHNSTRQNKFHQ